MDTILVEVCGLRHFEFNEVKFYNITLTQNEIINEMKDYKWYIERIDD